MDAETLAKTIRIQLGPYDDDSQPVSFLVLALRRKAEELEAKLERLRIGETTLDELEEELLEGEVYRRALVFEKIIAYNFDFDYRKEDARKEYYGDAPPIDIPDGAF